MGTFSSVARVLARAEFTSELDRLADASACVIDSPGARGHLSLIRAVEQPRETLRSVKSLRADTFVCSPAVVG